VAICSKTPPNDVRKGFHDNVWDQQKRIIAVTVYDFVLLNVYAPHGDLRGTEKHTHKLHWFAKLKQYLTTYYAPEDKIIVVGDFNVIRSDLDVYDVEITKGGIGTMMEERRAFQELLDWGLRDPFRQLYPEKRQFTWWDYIGGAIWRDEGMRIDYILCSQPLSQRIKRIDIDLWTRRRRIPKPSDHAPVIATLEV
jgi:exodeoxyribonuclease-3